MSLQLVQDRVSPGGELLPTRLTLQILNGALRAVLSIRYQRVDLFLGDAIVTTARVGAEETLCRKLLLASPATLFHAPRLRHLAFDSAAIAFLLLTEAAVSLKLRFQHHRLARLPGLFFYSSIVRTHCPRRYR